MQILFWMQIWHRGAVRQNLSFRNSSSGTNNTLSPLQSKPVVSSVG